MTSIRINGNEIDVPENARIDIPRTGDTSLSVDYDPETETVTVTLTANDRKTVKVSDLLAETEREREIKREREEVDREIEGLIDNLAHGQMDYEALLRLLQRAGALDKELRAIHA